MAPVKIPTRLLELGEILDGLERALRTTQPLDLHAAQRRGVDAMTGFLWAGVGSKVRGLVGMAVRVAVEAGYAAARQLGATILRLIELLVRERSDEQAKPFQLLGSENAVKQGIIILAGEEPALRYISGGGGLVCASGRRKIRQVS